jgi:hypothetical protein
MLLELIRKTEKEIAEKQNYLRALRAAAIAGGELTADAYPDTALGMAEVIMREVKIPMKPREIADRIREKFGREIKPSSLSTMLYKAAVLQEETFVKDTRKKNTYRLRDPKAA